MKRKILAGMLLMTMALGTAACAGNDSAGSGQSQGTEESTDTEASGQEEASSGTEETDGEVSQGAEAEEDGSAASEEAAASEAAGDSSILVAYFSVPEDVDTEGIDANAGASIVVRDGEVLGNIQYMADVIQQTVGGDLFRIETTEQYPLDHEPLVDQAAQEQDENARPQLSTQLENIDQYDTILLGYPNWWGDMPQAVYSFFDEYDFGGKTIIPFNSHNGSRFSNTIATIQELEPDARVVEDGFTVNERDVPDAAEDIAEWVAGLDY